MIKCYFKRNPFLKSFCTNTNQTINQFKMFNIKCTSPYVYTFVFIYFY